MKICVIGPGAVGGHMLALLARADADVSTVARGAHLAALASRGLTLHGDHGSFTVPVKATGVPAELGVQDFVLVTVKSTGLAAVAPLIAPLLGPQTSVAFFQNGLPWWYGRNLPAPDDALRFPELDPGDALWKLIPDGRLIGASTASAGTVVAPGEVRIHGGEKPIVLGEPDGGGRARHEQLAELLRQAGFPVQTTARLRDQVWNKLAQNIGSGLMSALTEASLQDLFAAQACVEARFRMQAELAAIADAWGCGVMVDFGAQMAWLRTSPAIPSIGQDVIKRRLPEFDSMFTLALKMGRARGVATPTLDLLTALVRLRLAALGLLPH